MSTFTQNKQGLKVLAAGSAIQLFLGILYLWSVFVIPVSEVYAWDINAVKLTTSFLLSFFVVGILAGGKLQLVIGAGRVVLLGGLMLSGGLLLTGLLPASLAWIIYISYGVLGGFGVGAGYGTIISAAQRWFPQNRGLATGISVSTFGFSTVLFAPLNEVFIWQFGVRNTFMILGISFLLVVLALFRFIRLPDDSGPAAAPSAALLAKRQYTFSETIRTGNFYFITGAMMLATATYFILNPSFKTLALERGLDDSFGTILVMLTGITSALGRLAAPILSDKIGREKAAITIILGTALSAALLCLPGSILFMAAVAVIAFCFGGYSGVFPVLTADYFGIKNVGANYGGVMVGFAVSALFFPMALGFIDSYTVKFVVLAASACIGAIMIRLLTVSGKQ